MTWTDYPGGSVRLDGAKVGEFCIEGRIEWWGYGAGWRPRSDVPVIGPFNYRNDAKGAMDSQLPFFGETA